DRGDGVDDDHPPGAIELGGRGSEAPHDAHIEQDVKNASVKPARAQEGPPSAELEDRDLTARPEEKERLGAGAHEAEEPAFLDALGVDGGGGGVERDRAYEA